MSKDVYKNLWRTIARGGKWTGEFQNKKKNGEIYWESASISAIKNEQGKITNYLGVKEDITKRKQFEKMLAQSLQKQNVLNKLMKLSVKNISLKETLDKALLVLMSEDCIILKSKGGIFLSNENNELELVAENNFEPELLAKCKNVPFGTCFCGRAALHKTVIHADCVNHENENSYEGMSEHGHYSLPILLNEKLIGVIVLYLEPGHKSSQDEIEFLESVAGTLALIIDKRNSDDAINNYNNQLKRQEKELLQRTQDLTELNKALIKSEKKLIKSNADKDKFFSIISHDLRSPFTALLGYTEMMEDDYSELSEDEIKESIHSIRETSEHVFALLNNLLEWARTQTNAIPFAPVIFDLYENAQTTINLFEGNCNFKKITLNNLIAKETKVFGETNMIGTVIRNLVSNALKFTDEGGNININFEEKDEKFGVVNVSDTGVGMDSEDINKLFRVDVHHTTVGTNHETGTGVGLILCKELVQKNGGEIWVESEIGKGSQFKFTVLLQE